MLFFDSANAEFLNVISGLTLMILKVADPDENIAFRIMAKIATLMESSTAAAATTIVGIPLDTP